MAGVQMMPAVAAVAARAEGSMRRSRRVGVPVMMSMSVADWTRRRPRRVRALRQSKSSSRGGGLGIVCNLGGQYEDNFEDVQLQMMNYFTYKAVRTVLTQLYEMNPPSYRWFYNFVAVNKPTDGKLFLRALGKAGLSGLTSLLWIQERQELAERVMITRLHLYGKWIKKCDHAKMYEMISDENLALMRERLMETVIWPTEDDADTEKIG